MYAQTFWRLFLGVYVTSVPGALLDSDYLRHGVYKSQCTVMRTGTLFYCTSGQGITFLSEKYREVHMPFIYHSGTLLTYHLLQKPFYFWTEAIIAENQQKVAC